jgi:Putative restriction endonuclease
LVLEEELELASEVLRAAFGAGWRVRVQMPLVLGQSTDPEPDLALVAGSARGTTAHPTSAALVVEVSDASLRYDTTVKQSLYAAAGIADYWVLDVTGRRVLVFRDPRLDPSQPHGHGYATQAVHAPGAAVHPLAVPTAAVPVADLLP